MRRIIYILFFTALTLPIVAQSYRSSGGEHYFGLYAEGAYSRLHEWNSDLKFSHGYEASVGALYEYEHNSFIMNIGCGFSWQTGGWKLPNTIHISDSKAQDTQRKTYTLSTYVNREDEIRRGYIDVPVLIGGQWGKFYMLGGVKAGIRLLDYSRMNATITSFGDYDRYFGPIHDASNHAFRTDVPLSQSLSFDALIDVRLSYEIGSWLGTIESEHVDVKARIAAFVDYGVFTSKVHDTDIAIGDITNNHEFSSYDLFPLVQFSGNNFLGNLLAGIKLTVLIGGSPNSGGQCRHCNILNDTWRPIRNRKKCVVCE